MKQINFITNTVNMFNIFVYVPAGSIYEYNGIRGISHLLEHMLMKHTKQYTNKELYKEITKIGGISNAGTSKDITYYYIKTHIDNYKLAIKLMNDIINHPVFTMEELEKEKKIVLEEFAQKEDSIDSILDDLGTLTVMKEKNEYSYPIRGYEKDIKNITLKDLRAYFKRTYSKYIILINCDRNFLKEAKIEVHKHFNDKDINLSVDMIVPKHINALHENGLVVTKQYDTISQFTTILSFTTYPINMVKELVILHFIRFIITSAGFNSILFSEIREKRGLVYYINSYHEDNRFMGILKINFASTNPNTQYIISIILSYLKNLCINGISESKLKYFKESYFNRTKYVFADESMKEMWFGNALFYNLNITKDQYIEMVKNISNDDIMNISKYVFNFKKMGVASCGKYPIKGDKTEKEILDVKNTYSIL